MTNYLFFFLLLIGFSYSQKILNQSNNLGINFNFIWNCYRVQVTTGDCFIYHSSASVVIDGLNGFFLVSVGSSRVANSTNLWPPHQEGSISSVARHREILCRLNKRFQGPNAVAVNAFNSFDGCQETARCFISYRNKLKRNRTGLDLPGMSDLWMIEIPSKFKRDSLTFIKIRESLLVFSNVEVPLLTELLYYSLFSFYFVTYCGFWHFLYKK